jgi:ABC-type sugar transport system permease subunit
MSEPTYPPTATTTVPPEPPTDTAFTGGEVSVASVAALVLVIVGVAALAVARRAVGGRDR